MNPAALQDALFNVLSGDATLLAELSTAWTDSAGSIDAVFTDLPEENAEDDAFYPFVSFGRDATMPFDTKTSDGGSALVEINVWTRSADYVQAKQIAERIWALLHNQSLTISGCDHILTKMQDADFSLDPDGKTRRALMFFRIVYDNT